MELNKLEIAAAAAATATIKGMAPGRLPLDHPLVTANQKLEEELKRLGGLSARDAMQALVDIEGN
jgi:hypothetical protein